MKKIEEKHVKLERNKLKHQIFEVVSGLFSNKHVQHSVAHGST